MANTVRNSRRSGRRFRRPNRNVSVIIVRSPSLENSTDDDENDSSDEDTVVDTGFSDEDTVVDDQESLSRIFERGVVLQRSGDREGALNEYKLFVIAAEGCDASPKLFAKVHANIGAIYWKDKSTESQELAKQHFKLAIGYRPVGTAYLNLALIALQKGFKNVFLFRKTPR